MPSDLSDFLEALKASWKATFMAKHNMTEADWNRTPAEEAARKEGVLHCRRRARRFMAEERAIYESDIPADEQLRRWPTMRLREQCVKNGGQTPGRPVCTFPACGAPETLGIPLDAETRARFKIPKMEHDPE